MPAYVSNLMKESYVQTLTGLASTLAAGGSDESDVITLEPVDQISLIVQVTCTFNASATAGLTVKCLSSLDNTTYDDSQNPIASGSISVQPGATATRTFYFQVYARSTKIRLENDDSTYSITGISVKYYVPPRQPVAR